MTQKQVLPIVVSTIVVVLDLERCGRMYWCYRRSLTQAGKIGEMSLLSHWKSAGVDPPELKKLSPLALEVTEALLAELSFLKQREGMQLCRR